MDVTSDVNGTEISGLPGKEMTEKVLSIERMKC